MSEQYVVLYYFEDGDELRYVLNTASMTTALSDASKFIEAQRWESIVIGVKIDPLLYPTFRTM